ncbi:hypothetical protein NDU88_000171 [Pleurodeles waltl]|uniref:Uncharacterized protein n=1 Tax=Pleurodeles waltl TaxID=8319 RepID=A0AAV7KP76_PLEWA|nr:hypothetical protein NDU88_000171 [Pleurodeles waltl]
MFNRCIADAGKEVSGAEMSVARSLHSIETVVSPGGPRETQTRAESVPPPPPPHLTAHGSGGGSRAGTSGQRQSRAPLARTLRQPDAHPQEARAASLAPSPAPDWRKGQARPGHVQPVTPELAATNFTEV